LAAAILLTLLHEHRISIMWPYKLCIILLKDKNLFCSYMLTFLALTIIHI